jgi:hypothetical protein
MMEIYKNISKIISKVLDLFSNNKYGKLQKTYSKVFKIYIQEVFYIEILNVQIFSKAREYTNSVI